MADTPDRKKIDESWKDSVDRERRDDAPSEASSAEPSSFSFLVSSLAMQALAALGEIPDPSGQVARDLVQARAFIDILAVLAEKTKGNLTPEESQLLEGALYELHTKFVQTLQAEQAPKA